MAETSAGSNEWKKTRGRIPWDEGSGNGTRGDGGVTLFFVPLLGQDIDFFYFIIRGSHPLAARKTCHPVERPLPSPG